MQIQGFDTTMTLSYCNEDNIDPILGSLLAHMFLELGRKFLHERRVDHLLKLRNLVTIFIESYKSSVYKS